MELNKLSFCFLCVMVLFGILGFIFIILVYTTCKSTNTVYLSTIASNWNTGILINPSINANDCGLPSTSPFISRSWPGTVTGCYTSSFSRGACGRRSGGRTYSAIPKVPYYFWRGYRLCSSRVGATYLDLTIVENAKFCPTNFRSCGIIDTIGNVMCVPVSTACPINYLKFIAYGQPLPTGFNYTKVDLTGGSLVYSNFNTNGQLLVELDLSENQPCADPNYKNYNFPPFILEYFWGSDKCINSVFGELYDNYYKQLDEYSFFQVYQENSINTLLKTLPTYSSYLITIQTSQRTLKLYYRNYIGIKVYCLNLIKQDPTMAKNIIQDLLTINKIFVDVQSVSLYALIFGSIGIAFLLGMLISFMICCNDIGFKEIMILLFPPILFMLAVFIVACICVAKISGVSTAFKILADNNCADPSLLIMISNTVNNSSAANIFSILSLIFSLFNILVYIGLILSLL